MSNSAAYGNAYASTGRQTSSKHTNPVRNIRASKHSIAKYAVLYIIVQGRQDRGDSTSNRLIAAVAAI